MRPTTMASESWMRSTMLAARGDIASTLVAPRIASADASDPSQARFVMKSISLPGSQVFEPPERYEGAGPGHHGGIHRLSKEDHRRLPGFGPGPCSFPPFSGDPPMVSSSGAPHTLRARIRRDGLGSTAGLQDAP